MLTYKTYVMARLEDYVDARAAVLTIPGRIKELRLKRETLKMKLNDSQPVTGGGNRTEDAWIASLAEEDYLARRLEASAATVAEVEPLLDQLTPEDRLIVERTCMRRHKGDVEELCGELGYERSAVYSMRDRAMRTLARLMTGEARA